MKEHLPQASTVSAFLAARLEVAAAVTAMIDSDSALAAYEQALAAFKSLKLESAHDQPEKLFFGFWAIRLAPVTSQSAKTEYHQLSADVFAAVKDTANGMDPGPLSWLFQEYFLAREHFETRSGQLWSALACSLIHENISAHDQIRSEGKTLARLAVSYDRLNLEQSYNESALAELSFQKEALEQLLIKIRNLRLQQEFSQAREFIKKLELPDSEEMRQIAAWESALTDVVQGKRASMTDFIVKKKPHRKLPFLAHAFFIHIAANGSPAATKFPVVATLKDYARRHDFGFGYLVDAMEVLRLPSGSRLQDMDKLAKIFGVIDADKFQHGEEKLQFLAASIATLNQMQLFSAAQALLLHHQDLSRKLSGGKSHMLYLLPQSERPRSHIPQTIIGRNLSFAQMLAKSSLQFLQYRARLAVTVKERHAQLEDEYFEALAKNLSGNLKHLRGVAAKLGQSASHFSQKLHPAIIEQLKELRQENNVAIAGSEVIAFLTEQYGQPVENVFSSFDQRPIGIGSIGQVHRAVLRNGVEVAVKIKIPGIMKSIKSDYRSMMTVLPMISFMFKGADVEGIFKAVFKQAEIECDYGLEIGNLTLVNRISKRYPRIKTPEVYREFCTENIIVMDYLRGQTFDDFKYEATQASKNQVAQDLGDFLYDLIRDHNLINSDPQAGNILIDGGIINIVDWGSLNRIEREKLQKEVELTRALTEGPPEAVLASFRDNNIIPIDAKIDGKKLAASFIEHMRPMAQKEFKYDAGYMQHFYSRVEGITEYMTIPSDHLPWFRFEMAFTNLMVELEAEGNFQFLLRKKPA